MTKHGAETILPYNKEEKKVTQVKRMFDSIAKTYDTLNHTLSLGLDRLWRRKGINYLKRLSPSVILDLATGTGDLAISMGKRLNPQLIVGADVSEGMMNVGKAKVAKEGLSDIIRFEYQDALSMTYSDNMFDAVTAAFGVRNYEDIEKGLKEMNRILKPGGHLMILELTTPEYFPMKQLYRIYSRLVIPAVGKMLSHENNAYNYLPESIKVMPQGQEMVTLLTKAGFIDAQVKKMTFGICSMYTGTK